MKVPLEKWNKMVEELGLEGQTNIVSGEKSPIPFMHLKSSMVNVFETLCPRQVNVTEYNVTPIPVEILDLIALSKREEYFQDLQIWYDDKSPDPACIGITGHWYQSTWGTGRVPSLENKEFKTKQELLDAGCSDSNAYFTTREHYLLGKWADVKHSFEELKQMATERYTKTERVKIEDNIKNEKRRLEDLESEAFNRFN